MITITHPSPEILRGQLADGGGAARVGYQIAGSSTKSNLAARAGLVVHAADFGDTDTDVGAAVNAALAAGHKRVLLPQTSTLLTTINLPENTAVIGHGKRASFVDVAANVPIAQIQGNYSTIFGFDAEPSVAHTVDGIIIGNGIPISETGWLNGARTTLAELHINGFGNDNIVIHRGNLGNIHNVTSVLSGRDALQFAGTSIDSNAWAFSGYNDLRGAGRDGLHIAGPTAFPGESVPSIGSGNHAGGLIVCQNNTRHGFYGNWRACSLTVYSEASGGNDIELGPTANGNRIVTTLATASKVVDNSSQDYSNVIDLENADAGYNRYMRGQRLENFMLSSPARAGQLVVTQPSDRLFEFRARQQSNHQTVEFVNDVAGFDCYVKSGGFQGRSVTDGRLTFEDGDTTPDISAGDLFYARNTTGTTITYFDGRSQGQRFTIGFTNSNTTIANGTNIRLAGGVNFTPSADDTLTLAVDGSRFVEVCRSANG